MKVNTYDKRHVRCEYGIYHDTEEPQVHRHQIFSSDFRQLSARSDSIKNLQKMGQNIPQSPNPKFS